MSRTMPSGLMELLARKDKRIESHTTIQISINNGDIMRNYYFASAELTIGGIAYSPQLRRGSQLKSSLTRAADQATVDLQNVDTALGREFLSLGQAIYGADTKIGRFWRDLDSGAEYHKVMLTGPLVGLQISEENVTLTAVSEPYANIAVGATRRVVPGCQWGYKNPNTCGSTSSEAICNFLLTNSGGCVNRHAATVNRAKFGGFAYINSSSRLKTI